MVVDVKEAFLASTTVVVLTACGVNEEQPPSATTGSALGYEQTAWCKALNALHGLERSIVNDNREDHVFEAIWAVEDIRRPSWDESDCEKVS